MFHHLNDSRDALASRACPVCSGHPYRRLFEKDGYQYVACDECGMVYINPIPAERALEDGYEQLSEEYFLAERRRAVDTYSQRHAREVALLRKAGGSGRLLDVGCATGSFLHAASRAGFTDLTGIDIAGPSIEAARSLGLKARAGDFPAGVFEPASFDVVTMWNTLEHLPAPYAFVAEAFRVLISGGLLAISVPNFDSLSVRLLGTRYRYIGLAHLNYFTPRTLTRLVRRAGFDVLHTETRSFNPYVVWKDFRGSEPDTNDLIRETELSKSFKTEAPFAPARLAYAVVDRGLRAIGRGDSLLIAARKPAKTTRA